MTGLIDEIQRESLDRQIPIEDLLRRVKLAAAKLGLEQIEDWVDQELNGYKNEIPEYRIILGKPVALNPVRGWIPLGGDPKLISFLSQRSMPHSVSHLRNMVDEWRGSSHGVLAIDPQVEANILAKLSVPMTGIGSEISRSAIVSVLDTVRSRVLQWAIDVEKLGIRGEGMSFSREEKIMAQTTTNTFHIGSIGNFAGNLGSGNSAGDISLNAQEIAQVRKILQQVRESVPALLEQGAGAELGGLVEAIDAEITSGKPDGTKLGGLVMDARNALSGATGNLLATGALSAIASIAQIFGL